MATIREGTYWDNRPAITSNSLFAHERKNGKPKWQYIPETGALLNPSFTLTEDKAYFLESRNPATLQAKDGRATYAQFVESHGADLVAIDEVTGKEAWRQHLQFPKGVQNSSLLCAKGRLVLQYSRNDKTVRYDSRAFDSSSGNLLWTQTQDNRNRPGGDHGEQDHHPVVIDDKLIIEPLAYDLATGKRLPEYDLRRHGHGCGTMSASASSLYFRATNPTEYLLGERKLRRITTVSRPGCWINIIPAGGLVHNTGSLIRMYLRLCRTSLHGVSAQRQTPDRIHEVIQTNFCLINQFLNNSSEDSYEAKNSSRLSGGNQLTSQRI